MTSAIVTGASRGIGRATSVTLAERGCRLALIGRASPELDDTVRSVREAGAEATAIEADLEDPSATERAARRALEAIGPPDAVVNNAGTIERSAIIDTPIESWNRQIAVNLTAPFVLTRALLPAMLDRRTGRIVNVGSISSTLGTAGAAAY
jgi:NAD(P)-dependent dehydrogenase (short-subunit alcohol dehydrogenase family)